MKKLFTILFFVSILNTLYSQTITTNTIYRWNLRTGFKEVSTPPCPATDYSWLYYKADGNLYLLDESCVEKCLSCASGGTGSNLSYDAPNHQIDIDGGGTSATIPLAVADGSTFGLPAFSASGFTASSGVMSLETQMSITVDASGLKLVGDVTSPGNNKFYKTNGSGTRTWAGIKKADLDDLTIGEVLFGNMAGTGQVEQDPNLYFNGTTDRLSIGDNTPAQPASLYIKGQPLGVSYPLYIEDGNAAVHLLSLLSNGSSASLWFGSSNAANNVIEMGGISSGSGFTGFTFNHGFGFGGTQLYRMGEVNATSYVFQSGDGLGAWSGGFELEAITGDVTMPNLGGGGTQMVTADNNGKLGVQAIPGGGGGISALTNGSGTTVGGDLTSVDLGGALTSAPVIDGAGTHAFTFDDIRVFTLNTSSGRDIVLNSGDEILATAAADISFTSAADIILGADDDINLVPTDKVNISTFAGGGTRMVTADNLGDLGVATIPTGFTDELAQDASALLFTPDNGDIDYTYNDGTPDIAAQIKAGVIVNADINASAAIDATKLIDGSITNTELGYINTVTSNVQTQLDAKWGYTMQGSFGQFNPGDATTYYGGGAPQSGGTVAGVNRMYITRSGTIKACYILFDNGGTLGTSETSTIYLRVNNTSETAVSAAVTNDARPTVVSNTGLSIAVTAGDYVEMKWVTPTWPVTNPTNVRILGVFYVEAFNWFMVLILIGGIPFFVRLRKHGI